MERLSAGNLGDGRRGDALEMDHRQLEWSRHEAVMLNINDPATSEGSISERAFKRLDELVAELELEAGVAHMAHQVSSSAETMLRMHITVGM